jgi:transposase
MIILAMDLGQDKSVSCVLSTETGQVKFGTLKTTPTAVHGLLGKVRPDRLVIEICPLAGWVVDLARESGIDVQVADTSGEAWQYKKLKRKTDRDDALKLARLSALDQINCVHVPARPMRQWRGLIGYRSRLSGERTRIKNRIRALLLREAWALPSGKRAWSQAFRQTLTEHARPLRECVPAELWRGLLRLELDHLEQTETLLAEVEDKLDELARTDKRVRLVRTIPGIGPRTAEAIVTAIDDPQRFANGRQVGAYAGLTPRRFQSGQVDRNGRISKRGNRVLRRLLNQVAWLSLRYNPWARQTYERIRAGRADRKKIAITAVSRRLLVIAWAMLRDGRRFSPHRPAKLAVLAA